MSSTNKTATIELSQYVGTDKPTYLVDYNGDMLKIDNAIAADRDSITTAQNTADGAVTKADANKGSIDVINTQLNGDPEIPGDSGLSGDVSAIEGVVNTVTSLIGSGTPTTSEQTIIGAINGLEGAIAPREDGLLMANSYNVGEQFARGGSVYEVLQAITAGTAFASLVLNTDYKVADTLVEQIANGIVELPDGYYIYKLNQYYSITPDGVKKVRELLNELYTTVLTAVQAMPNDTIMEIIAIKTMNDATPLPIVTTGLYDNTATNVFTLYNQAEVDWSTVDKMDVTQCRFATTAAGCSHVKIRIGNSITHTDQSDDVPTSGSIRLYYNLYKKF